MHTPRVFVDMDGVLVDFDRYMLEQNWTPQMVKTTPYAYFDMKPMPGAIEAIHELTIRGYEVWIATKPPTGVPQAYADKVAWILKYLPAFSRRIIITHDKGLLGGCGDFLIDDRIHKANCVNFKGTLIEFKRGEYEWTQILESNILE